MKDDYEFPFLFQIIAGVILFIVLIWFAGGFSNNSTPVNYDNPDINSGYCNGRECW